MSIRHVLCVTVALAAGASYAVAAHAADDHFCKDYAQAAVSQFRTAETHERCEPHLRDEGSRWSNDYRAHYDWCRGVSREQAWDERNARKAALQRCTQTAQATEDNFCKDYAQAAVNQFRTAETHERCQHHLRNEGARWSNDYRVHYDWCRGAKREAARDERNARKYALEECTH